MNVSNVKVVQQVATIELQRIAICIVQYCRGENKIKKKKEKKKKT